MSSPGTFPHDRCADAGPYPRSPQVIPFDQLSGDLLCPMCGEPLEITIQRTDCGAEPVGQCALCIATVEIAL